MSTPKFKSIIALRIKASVASESEAQEDTLRLRKMEDPSSLTLATGRGAKRREEPVVSGLLAIYLILKWFSASTYKLAHIPTIGSSGMISSYRDAFRFFQHGHEMIDEGYKKHYETAFKVATISRWLVIVSGPQMHDDIRRATDDQLSFRDAVVDMLQTDYTIGPQNRIDPYHVKVVRAPLTRKFGAQFSDILDEISQAFKDLLKPAKENEWITVPAFISARNIVCRTSNRLFVGLPLCRDIDYKTFNENFTMDVVKKAQIINTFPAVLKPIVGRLVTKVQSNIRRTVSHLGPMMQAHLDQYNKPKDEAQSTNQSNDLISWLLEEAKESQRTLNDLAARILNVNFASIHTTSMGLTNILYDLAMYPEYVEPMREEVKAIVKTEGWTKSSIGKMRKVDSFVKESQRLASNSFVTMRKALKDFTFSNGVTVPAGTYLAVASLSTHLDENNYDNAHEFKGFRFADVREEEGEGTKHQMVSLSPDFLTFGTGRHACPGRFLAASQLKATLAHVLLNYDVELANKDGSRPKSIWTMGQVAPNMTADVKFRKRVL
ncbi:hypothetical protein CVT25_007121 [Psilocybe cyanescens]|uniref:Cytochrome P450 n=1 Tax=Psilocybe cyanescens TaxID=93625 RepID=A0A409WVS9_PSICY|nr:hypothetical protein CVT25_007121 [Psilocybe cyanescens]